MKLGGFVFRGWIEFGLGPDELGWGQVDCNTYLVWVEIVVEFNKTRPGVYSFAIEQMSPSIFSMNQLTDTQKKNEIKFEPICVGGQ